MEHTEFKQALGQMIYKLRKERNISQEQLALDADVDRTRLGEIERGEANPTIDTLIKVADVMSQTLGSLIIEAEEISSGVTKGLVSIAIGTRSSQYREASNGIPVTASSSHLRQSS